MSSNNVELNAQDLDKEAGSGSRELTGIYLTLTRILAIAISLYAIWSNALSNSQEFYRNTLFLVGILCLGFILFPFSKKHATRRFNFWDYLFIALTLISYGYFYFFYYDLHVVRKSVPNLTDYVMAAIGIAVLFEGARRTTGYFIPGLATLAIIYAIFGQYFLGIFGHAGFSVERLLYRLFMTSEGIFGITLSTASTAIVVFILFGAFLSVSGATLLFNDLAMAVAGRRRGGPAQVAVISSALTGSLSGSAVANVATTGTFTIPLMKSIGLTPRFAGAVEATASTGGMIMPPIMGAAAFIMAGFLGISYGTIVMAAVIPALLYYGALVIAIDFEARKQGLKGISKENIPRVKTILKQRGLLLLPLIIVIGTLLTGRTPIYAGFLGILSIIAASWLSLDTSVRMTPKKIAIALDEAARGSIQVTLACAAIGVIICVVTMTGIGATLAFNIVAMTGGELWLILVVVMVVCIVLSMGLPSTALYIVVAVTASPILIQAGVNPLAAHFFVFWFGALSNITPPVALASYTAASIARSDPMQTSWTAVRLALPGFVIPFMLVYNPGMLLQGDGITAFSIIHMVVSALVGIYALSAASTRFWRMRTTWLETLVLVAAALLLIKPGLYTDIGGLCLIGVAWLLHLARVKRQPVTGHVDA
ncbi:TRAP transporter permease [Shimwellia blattae]|uniref:TRAP-type transport system permease component n=1 Tax=Shimwellia blattae (strain ATCC 29907 / DSM 4481 / JCM 1650 / NBRC 105725 / CDC 9005-74) TaxID=630626 RepID=I2B922_SHIBC|nr:TRAP transporter permease [Shimwellia blattae]AFJ47026.1 TRAP-type transport system permease component [Shimwellia blattae DSM 4481 = NBRC 105725]GAB80851.1 putative TRAP-type C4-dicarboxylate transport system permease protein [Shimwellia blattae DSM 4481 = NBRC 105725]VDY64520.1 Neu5Ac permease [Shimwellia blattae]VEC22628.1 Neu5Ac permease [Shimwellia blattae]